MPLDDFNRISELLPEICLLVDGGGTILSGNQAARTAGFLAVDRAHSSLLDVVDSPAAGVRDYLRACSRSRQALPGSLMFSQEDRSVAFHCQGSLFEPRSASQGARILLRLTPKQHAVGGFAALNERLAELDTEVRRRKQTEERLREQSDRLSVTLTSIGDGVITTDDRGRVHLMNPASQRMTGWNQSEAAGRPLSEIFRIVNERTRQPAENPCDRVLRDGVVVGLANHTILTSRDGSERAIDDSAAPIKDLLGVVRGVVFVFRDVTEKRKVDEERARLAAIVESSEDAIISKNIEGRITSWNQAAERIFGYSAAEAIGQPINILAAADRPHEMEDILRRIRRGERVEHFDTVRRRKDGRELQIALTVSPIRSETGEVIGASKIARDVTERKEAEREREELHKSERAARAEAERANRMKDEFLATVSHEIRTPLNAILGWAQLLRSGKLDAAETAQGLEVIERNTRVQAQIIEDLLDMSRIMAGKIQLDLRPVELRDVIESVLAALRPSAEAKSLRLEGEIDPSVPIMIADAGRLQQVIGNLVSNAIKFSSPGGEIGVRVTRMGLKVEISVTDTGKGIRADFLPFVFDRFRQADSSTRREYGGLGLGLSIVKQLVELHGGTVRAESPGEGRGATFRIHFAIGESAIGREGEPSFVRRVNGGLLLAGLRVLVVDDDADSRALVARLLQEADIAVTQAATVADALRIVADQQPNLILSDIGMPGRDGYDLIREVRSLPSNRGGDIPAAALTAFARSEDRTRALLAGFQSHIAKPIDPSELLAVVGALARRNRG